MRDLRHAWRGLWRTPGFTFAAVLTLGLGIGATTAIFTVVNGVLLRPLPYQDSGRLADIWVDLGQGAQSLPAVSPADFRDYQRRSRSFAEFAAGTGDGAVNLRGNLTGQGAPERVALSPVTANFFPLLGVTPELGRNFTPEEEGFHGPHVLLLSHRLWQRRYGGDRSIIGRTIQLDGIGYTVVGVLPPDFRLLLPAEAFLFVDAEVWVPLQFDYSVPLPRNLTFFTVIGRLKPGVSFAQAQGDMSRIAEQFRQEFPEHKAANTRIRVVPLREDIVKHARPSLLTLMGAVGLVLLIACGNVAHLLLARGTARSGEFALRAALGASRWAMVRQLLMESGLLALCGGALGLAVTVLALTVLRAFHPASLPRLAEVDVDETVLAFTLLVSVVTTLLFGVVPALRASGVDPQAQLQSAGRGGLGPQRRRIRGMLIVGEVALSVVLLVGAGLLVRSFLALEQVRPGFDAGDVLTFDLSMPASRYPKGSDRRPFYRLLEERLRALPGVRQVGAVSQLPLTGTGQLSPFAYNEETARNFESVTADGRVVSPTYFKAMDTRLLAGRTFTSLDSAGAPPVIMIDETLARVAWPGQSAVGKQLQLQPTGTPNGFAEVVGVVEHMRMHDLARDGLPQIYYPLGQGSPATMSFVVETSVDPSSLSASVRQTVAALDKDLAVHRLTPMEGYLAEGLAQARFSLVLMSVLGGMALLLAAIGIFGVISYSVTQRTREFGIRLALGEDPHHTLRTVILSGMRLVLLSLALGLGASFLTSRLIAGLLYGVRPADPLTFGGIAALLGLVALCACYLPARRATRVDPASALRSE
ncbi:MAG: ABC transporter permease [Gemmatimonadales bacterium]